MSAKRKKIKKCCGNCVYADQGTCGFAGEISSDFWCTHYIESLTKKQADMKRLKAFKIFQREERIEHVRHVNKMSKIVDKYMRTRR